MSSLFVAEDGKGNDEQEAGWSFNARWHARNATHRRLVYLITRAVLHRRFAVIYGEIVLATSDDLRPSTGSGTGVKREREREREREQGRDKDGSCARATLGRRRKREREKRRKNESAKRFAGKKNAKGFGHLSPALLPSGHRRNEKGRNIILLDRLIAD